MSGLNTSPGPVPSNRPRPRCLRVNLGALEPHVEAAVDPEEWRACDPLIDHVGSWGGPAAALALFQDTDRQRGAFALAVGPAVARGVPTSARAVVMAHAPLAGGVREGQVGSDLARRLARVTDLLWLEGRVEGPGAVLILGDDSMRLEFLPELIGLDPEQTHRTLEQLLGPCATLRVGPAGEAGLNLANLAAGTQPASFVGRGGLGAAFASHGLKALAITAQAVAPLHDSQWAAHLGASPRLAARAEGGSMELFESLAARSALGARGGEERVSLQDARAFGRQARERLARRHGCSGCPTPCGWVLDGPETEDVPAAARFSALHPLGQNLGLEEIDGARRLLACCNRLGIDAKEAGARLAWEARQRPALWGDAAGLEELLEQMVRGEQPEMALGHGVRERAPQVGPGPGARAPARGDAGLDSNLAVVLGACAGVRGGEPMRTFPFLVGTGLEGEGLERLVAPMPLPPGAADPAQPHGKGRLVWWHENLVLALDLSGFCSFAAAGMLADGVLDLDGLARLLGVQEGDSPAVEWLGRGAMLAELWSRIAVNSDRGPRERAQSVLQLPGMWNEYQLLRGVGLPAEDPLGERIIERALARLDTPERAPGPGCDRVEGRAAGQVRLRASGPLGQKLGEQAILELDLPTGVRSLVAEAARHWPDAAPLLEREGDVLPGVHRRGRQLNDGDLIRDGDELDLVLVVSGG